MAKPQSVTITIYRNFALLLPYKDVPIPVRKNETPRQAINSFLKEVAADEGCKVTDLTVTTG